MSFGEKFLNSLGFESEKQRRVKDLETRIEGLRGVIRNMEGVPQERDLVSTDIGEIPDDASLLQRHKTNLEKLQEELAKLRATI
jgi:hypothetical protein